MMKEKMDNTYKNTNKHHTIGLYRVSHISLQYLDTKIRIGLSVYAYYANVFAPNFPRSFSTKCFVSLCNFATFGEVVQHQIQCLIFASQQRNVSNFWWISNAEKTVAQALLANENYKQIAFTELIFNPFQENFSLLFSRLSKTNFVECMNPHFVFVEYFTHHKVCHLFVLGYFLAHPVGI